mmetsp:Transcript_27429/g.60308  ORF Transcript_27429/g.60308 Transcript_27429/m.60308 type:complete len:350 (+) Transcript_27429:182-1231(+)
MRCASRSATASSCCRRNAASSRARMIPEVNAFRASASFLWPHAVARCFSTDWSAESSPSREVSSPQLARRLRASPAALALHSSRATCSRRSQRVTSSARAAVCPVCLRSRSCSFWIAPRCIAASSSWALCRPFRVSRLVLPRRRISSRCSSRELRWCRISGCRSSGRYSTSTGPEAGGGCGATACLTFADAALGVTFAGRKPPTFSGSSPARYLRPSTRGRLAACRSCSVRAPTWKRFSRSSCCAFWRPTTSCSCVSCCVAASSCTWRSSISARRCLLSHSRRCASSTGTRKLSTCAAILWRSASKSSARQRKRSASAGVRSTMALTSSMAAVEAAAASARRGDRGISV